MQKKLKLVLSLLALTVSLSINATIKSGSCGDNATYRLEDDGTLYIEGSGDMWDCSTYNYATWYYYRSQIIETLISEGITSIGEYAFYGCTGLTSITIPNSVTSIGEDAFRGCKSLTTITIPNSVTSIASTAFDGCTSLPVENNIRYADTYLVGVTDKSLSEYEIKEGTRFIGPNAFSYCSNMMSFIVPSSVINIDDYAFYGCTSLPIEKNIRYADTYLVEVTDKSLSEYEIKEGTRFIGTSAFYNCLNLNSITIPNSVTSIGSDAFSGCKSLTSITLPNFVTSVGSYAFAVCSNLTSITLPNSITSIGSYTFDGCSNLTSITLPNSVTSIGGSAFRYCSSLNSVTIPNSVTRIGSRAFEGCQNLTNIYIDNLSLWMKTDGTDNATSANIKIKHLYVGEEEVTNVILPSEVTEIYNGAFNYIPIRSVISKAETVPVISSTSFSVQTYNHAPLYVPSDSYYDYVFDRFWYQFINIKKYVDNMDKAAEDKAYMLMNEANTRYIVYDNVNDKLNTIDISDMDESNLNNSWMVMNVDGKQYLYNIGAKKYAVRSNNSIGYELAEGIHGVSEANTRASIVNDSNIFYVENGSVFVDEKLKDEVLSIGSIKMDENVNDVYSVSGTRMSSPHKGINIIRSNDGTIRKVYVK